MTQQAETTRVDLHDPVAEICERLGLNYDSVAELRITPRRVEARVFKVNGRGSFFATFSFDVST